jgi:hypothetical protein
VAKQMSITIRDIGRAIDEEFERQGHAKPPVAKLHALRLEVFIDLLALREEMIVEAVQDAIDEEDED